MIRQAISCDICGTEKRQTNHWFVAYEQAGELRIGGWASRQRMRAGAKHLCGQTCLHKLVDEYMAQSINPRGPRTAEQREAEPSPMGDTSLTSAAAYREPELPRKHRRQQAEFAPPAKGAGHGGLTEEPESSARLLTPPSPVPAKPASPPQPDIVTMPLPPKPDELPPVPAEPRYHSRSWRAEAWERERERELRAQNRPDIAARRRSHA